MKSRIPAVHLHDSGGLVPFHRSLFDMSEVESEERARLTWSLLARVLVWTGIELFALEDYDGQVELGMPDAEMTEARVWALQDALGHGRLVLAWP